MAQTSISEYFYGEESEQFSYFRIPRLLVRSKKFKTLFSDAKLLYCTNISWSDAQPGDLVFYPDDSHVGIVGGKDADGNLLIVHCSGGANGVVITGSAGFTVVARPDCFEQKYHLRTNARKIETSPLIVMIQCIPTQFE